MDGLLPSSLRGVEDSNYDGDQACATSIKDVKNDISMIDCISTSVTICSACHKMGLPISVTSPLTLTTNPTRGGIRKKWVVYL
jgi:hypothetical protein